MVIPTSYIIAWKLPNISLPCDETLVCITMSSETDLQFDVMKLTILQFHLIEFIFRLKQRTRNLITPRNKKLWRRRYKKLYQLVNIIEEVGNVLLVIDQYPSPSPDVLQQVFALPDSPLWRVFNLLDDMPYFRHLLHDF